MAILKHISSKNANYYRAMEYLMYQHDRFTNKPLLDENGRVMMREDFLMNLHSHAVQ